MSVSFDSCHYPYSLLQAFLCPSRTLRRELIYDPTLSKVGFVTSVLTYDICLLAFSVSINGRKDHHIIAKTNPAPLFVAGNRKVAHSKQRCVVHLRIEYDGSDTFSVPNLITASIARVKRSFNLISLISKL